VDVELEALATATIEIEWLREPLRDLHMAEKPISTLTCKQKTKVCPIIRNYGVLALDYVQMVKNRHIIRDQSRTMIDIASIEMVLKPT
jgi:hypothetical protein